VLPDNQRLGSKSREEPLAEFTHSAAFYAASEAEKGSEVTKTADPRATIGIIAAARVAAAYRGDTHVQYLISERVEMHHI
jgi:hypothetical protein